MFEPKWKKEANLLVKGSLKFLHYKRDLLKADRIEEIESRRRDLLAAIKAGDQAKTDEASKQLRATCEGSLPNEPAVTWWEENVEVMFVAIVVALGLRAYFLQPFRIPTGSMQPTLNGIIAKPLAEKDWPSLPVRLWEATARGRSYVKVVNDEEREIAVFKDKDGNLQPDIRDVQLLHFFSRSEIRFTDGSALRLPAPLNPCMEIGLLESMQKAMAHRRILPKGAVICEGTVDAGDLVLVDRFSYHFRKPQRGEVFVFDTRGIEGTRHVGDQSGVTHYIKRLCALPGDRLSIQPPNILINDRITYDGGIRNVYDILFVRDQHGNPLVPAQHGYILANPAHVGARLVTPSDALSLRDTAPPGLREYAALGDNTGNSLDSRYWGTVKEFNLVGPGFFSLWPLTSGHWGFIH